MNLLCYEWRPKLKKYTFSQTWWKAVMSKWGLRQESDGWDQRCHKTFFLQHWQWAKISWSVYILQLSAQTLGQVFNYRWAKKPAQATIRSSPITFGFPRLECLPFLQTKGRFVEQMLMLSSCFRCDQFTNMRDMILARPCCALVGLRCSTNPPQSKISKRGML
jgi:hypothetical protein